METMQRFADLRMSTPFDAPDWRGVSEQDRDNGLNNDAIEDGNSDVVGGWDRRSADMLISSPLFMDLAYHDANRTAG